MGWEKGTFNSNETTRKNKYLEYFANAHLLMCRMQQQPVLSLSRPDIRRRKTPGSTDWPVLLLGPCVSPLEEKTPAYECLLHRRGHGPPILRRAVAAGAIQEHKAIVITCFFFLNFFLFLFSGPSSSREAHSLYHTSHKGIIILRLSTTDWRGLPC